MRAILFCALFTMGCSGGSDAGGTGTPTGDASTPTPTPPTTDDGGTTAAPSDGGTDAPAGTGPGIQLTAAGTSYTLDFGGQAAKSANGYLIGATKIDGSTQRNLALIVNKAEPPGTTYVTPAPGTYPCTQPGTAPFMWARYQYVTPNGSTYQSPSEGAAGAACSVTIEAFGAVGESVRGSFSATLDRVAGTDPETVVVSGTFDVKRAN